MPDRFLAESKVPEVFVSPVAFPPDDRSMGWERGNFVSKAWDQAATDWVDKSTGELLTGYAPDEEFRKLVETKIIHSKNVHKGTNDS